jgi:hypothetical protein
VQGVYLFSTEGPFSSVGIPQVEFLHQVLALRNGHMDKDRFVRKAVALAADGSSSRWTYSSGLSPTSTTSLSSYSIKS